MIEFISGKIEALNPTAVVIGTTGGVGYLLNISLPTYTELQGKDAVRLLVHEAIREDAITLYGFLSSRERELFRALIGVSGVGANTAMVILSALQADELEVVITTGDEARLKRVKGIGQKTAQRIIVDLKDKIKTSGVAVPIAAGATISAEAMEEAQSALLILGFQKAAVQKVLKKLFEADPAMRVENAIKKALTML